MNASKLSCASLMIAWVMLGANAWARGHGSHHFPHGFHSHPRFGLYLGVPLLSYPYYSYPSYRYRYYDYPYYYPPVITVPSTPPVYIERPKSDAQEYPTGYWYYCSNPEGYYPYVKECPGGWQQIDPVPSETK